MVDGGVDAAVGVAVVPVVAAGNTGPEEVEDVIFVAGGDMAEGAVPFPAETVAGAVPDTDTDAAGAAAIPSAKDLVLNSESCRISRLNTIFLESMFTNPSGKNFSYYSRIGVR